MKHHKKTDRIIKSKMENYSMDAPMHLFEGIASALDGDVSLVVDSGKKSGRNGYWLMALLLLTFVGGGIWYGTSSSSSTQAAQISTSTVEGKISTSLDKKVSTNVINENEKTVEGNKNVVTGNVTQGSSTISNSSSAAINNEGSNSASSTASNESAKSENASAVFTNQVNTSSSSVLGNTENPTFINTIPKNKLTQKGASENTTPISKSNSEIISLSPETNSPVAELSQTVETNSTSNKTTQETFLKKNNIIAKAKEEVLFLPKLRSIKQVASKLPKEVTQVNVETACGLSPDGPPKFTTSVDALFSLDFASQILEYKSINYKEYAESRMDSESAHYSFSTGVRVNFLTEFNWALRTGLIYSQINEIYKIEKDVVLTTYDANGNIESSIPGTKIVNVLNHYRLVDIPILVGYETKLKKFNLNINGGVFLNLKSIQSGAFNSPFEQNAHLYFTKGHADDYDIFKDNIGFSTFLSLGFNIPLKDKKTQIIIEPNIRYYPKSFTLKEYILNQKYLTTGLMIGIRRDL